MIVDTDVARKKIEKRISELQAKLALLDALEDSEIGESNKADKQVVLPGVIPRETKRGMSKTVLRAVQAINPISIDSLFAKVRDFHPETSRQAVATAARRWEERGYLVVDGNRSTGLSVRLNPNAPKRT